jgi:hypothetical protein
MKRILFLFIFVLLTVLAFADEAEKFAIVVGVNDYENADGLLTNLKYAKNDAVEIANQLIQNGFKKENVVVLTNGMDEQYRPTAKNIQNWLEKMRQRIRPIDFFLLSLSGHGLELPDKSDEKKTESFFCPVETNLADERNKYQCLAIKEVYEAVNRISAEHKLMLVDACRNVLGTKAAGSPLGKGIQITARPPKHCILLQSCGKTQYSYEDNDLKHGYFSYTFIEGLKGRAAQDGEISVLGLASYVIRNTERHSNGRQKPYYTLPEGEHSGDFLLTNVIKPITPTTEMLKPERPANSYVTNIDRCTPKTVLEAEAAKDNPAALYFLAICYYHGENNCKKDRDKSSELFQRGSKLADSGNPFAQCCRGNCYDDGYGVIKNYKEAVKWYYKAAEQGLAAAQNSLGVCYERGNGVEQDYKEAAQWYRKAAEQDYMMAQRNLGICYKNTNGVEQDYKEATKWYRKAAEQGLEIAKEALERLENVPEFIELEGHTDVVTSAAFSPDGKIVVTAGDNTVRIWDVATGKELKILGYTNFVQSVVFSPNGKMFVTASGDKTARIWDVATGKVLKLDFCK